VADSAKEVRGERGARVNRLAMLVQPEKDIRDNFIGLLPRVTPRGGEVKELVIVLAKKRFVRLGVSNAEAYEQCGVS